MVETTILSLHEVTQSLQIYGLSLLGHGLPTADLTPHYPWASTLLLIGVVGDSDGSHAHSQAAHFWNIFYSSSEYQDQQPHAMDRWSQRIGKTLAQQWQGTLMLPFAGPPYWPFLTWAQTLGYSAPSRLGMHLHKHYGLWHSYRFAIAAPWRLADSATTNTNTNTDSTTDNTYQSPCPTCHKPCVSACPVDAFRNPAAYAVQPCRSYVKQCFAQPHTIAPHQNCAQQGCLARHVCPHKVGSYTTQQRQYHMRVFAHT